MHVCFLMQGFLLDRDSDVIVGPLVQTYLLGRELARIGHRVSYISLVSGSIERREYHDGIDVHYLPVPDLPMRSSELLACRKAERLLRELSPDAVYTRGRTALPYAAARYARGSGAVSVWNAARDRDFNGDEYVRMKILELPAFKRPVGRILYSLVMNTLFERGVRNADVVIVQNRKQLESYRARFGDRIPHILMSVVDLSARIEGDRSDFELTWISGLKPEKRPELFLDLVRRLRDLPIRCTMAGALLDPKYAEQIEMTKSLNPRFDYLGLVPFEETRALYERSSLLINTSVMEGFPNTYLQAWENEVPVLTICCDPSDVIADHGLGAVCPDVEEMEAEIRRFFADRGALAAVGRRCREYVELNHSPASIVSSLIGLIDAAGSVERIVEVPVVDGE